MSEINSKNMMTTLKRVLILLLVASVLVALVLLALFRNSFLSYEIAEMPPSWEVAWQADMPVLTYLQANEDKLIALQDRQTLLAIELDTGQINWTYSIPRIENFLLPQGIFAIEDQRLIVNVANQELVALMVDDGRVIWTKPLVNQVGQIENLIMVGQAVTISGKDKFNQGLISSYSTEDGEHIASKIFYPRTSVKLFRCKTHPESVGCAFVTTPAPRYIAIHSNGKMVDIGFDLPDRYLIYPSKFYGHWLIAQWDARTNESKSYVYNTLTDEEYSLTPSCGAINPIGRGVFMNEDLSIGAYVDGCGQLMAYDVSDWETPLWTVEIPNLLTEPIMTESEIVFLTTGMELWVYDMETGQTGDPIQFSPSLTGNNAQITNQGNNLFVYVGRTLFALNKASTP